MPTKKTTKKSAAKKVAKKTTKKTAKKTTAKKAVKATKKSDAKRPLVCAADEHCFWVVNGIVLRDLAELGEALATMDDLVYGHHVDDSKNDFATWVEEILEDGACAAALRKSKKPTSAKTAVTRHLRQYNLS